MPRVSIVTPVFQEEATLAACLRGTVAFMRSTEPSFEIVAVDDGSKDQSLAILRSLQAEIPELRVAYHLRNRGYGSALRTGVRVARGEIIVFMDADGQHTPSDIGALLDQLPPYDLVVGYRTESYRGAWYRNAGNRFYNRLSSWLANTEIKDLTSGFRAMRRDVILHFLPLFPAGFSASATATLAFLKAGYNVNFVPIHAHPRRGGRSKVNFLKDGWRFFLVILRIIMLYDPLRIFVPLSAGMVGLGCLAWGLGIWHENRLVLPNSTILFFVFALLTVLLGVLSGQLSNNRIAYFGDETIAVYENATQLSYLQKGDG